MLSDNREYVYLILKARSRSGLLNEVKFDKALY